MRISSELALWNPLKKFRIKRVFTWRDIYGIHIYIYIDGYIYEEVCVGEACAVKVGLLSRFLSLRSSATWLMKMYDPAPSLPSLLTARLLPDQQQRLLWWATTWRRDLPGRRGPAGVPWQSQLSHEFEKSPHCSARPAISDWTVIVVIININSYCVHPQALLRLRLRPPPPPPLHTRISMATIEFKWFAPFRSVPFHSIP